MAYFPVFQYEKRIPTRIYWLRAYAEMLVGILWLEADKSEFYKKKGILGEKNGSTIL
ncbi:MAG: hypothetical protein MH321_18595 [Leptospiraceae bacterium]|nr:hypothetical protein [Leptospiraceae bacterium]